MVFAQFLNDKPMGCNGNVLPELLFENHNVNCLTVERDTSQPHNDNFCLFRTLALHLHGNDKLEEETSNLFNNFLFNFVEEDPPKTQGGQGNDSPNVEDLLQLNIVLYHIDFVNGENLSELARRSIQYYDKIANFVRYSNHIR